MFFLKDALGNTISVIKIDPSSAKKSEKIVIFSHGNGCDIYTFSNQLRCYAEKFGCAFVCYDYLGYGLTEGNPSEENCYSAINVVVNHYVNKVGMNNVILVGQSLGTGVTIHCANEMKWKYPIILISPYKSIARVVYDSCVTESSFSHNMFCTYKKIGLLSCPIKIIHGTNDTVINVSHGKYLYTLLKNPLDPEWREGLGHNNIYLEERDIVPML